MRLLLEARTASLLPGHRHLNVPGFGVDGDTEAEYFMARATDNGVGAFELGKRIWSDLLPYKYPRFVEFEIDLPKTGTGKIDRQSLRSAASKRAG